MRTLTPGYGRDYTSALKAKQDYLAGMDFILRDISDPYDGKLCGKADFKGEAVLLRYNKMRRSTVVTA